MNQLEKQIGTAIAASGKTTAKKLGLRFDRVVVRLLHDIRQSVAIDVPKGVIVVMTITAPLKHPAKSVTEISAHIKKLLQLPNHKKDLKLIVFDNIVMLRIVHSSAKGTEKFIGLVHNPDIDAGMLIELTEQWLHSLQ